MVEHTVKMHLIPWDDPAFHEAVCRAWEHVVRDEPSVDRPDAARQAEVELHEAGYPEARVDYSRNVQDVMSATARWTVHRGAAH